MGVVLLDADHAPVRPAMIWADTGRYFVHGWTHAVEEVFDVPMTPGLVDELAAVAEGARWLTWPG